MTIDRTVAAGPITFKLQGTAVDETGMGYDIKQLADATVPERHHRCVRQRGYRRNRPAAAGGGTAVFTIGSTSYTMNGQSVTMDVAPYIKDGRTFLPLRYVANALGVPDSNISFNNGQIVINKNGTLVVLNIGSMIMLVGGATITMDVAPEITNGRTCLPIAWVAMALNCQHASGMRQRRP